MNPKILLFLVAIWPYFFCSAQTIPFGFAKSSPRSRSAGSAGRDADTVAQLAVAGLAIDYDDLIAKLEEEAEKQKTAAYSAYKDAVEFSVAPVDENELQTYRLAAEQAAEVWKGKMKTVQDLRRQVKVFEYQKRLAEGRIFFPVGNAVAAQVYYNGAASDSKAKFLSNSLLTYAPDGGTASLFNELYADYYGFLRVGFGALISNRQAASGNGEDENSEETKKDATQRLLGGGGNGVFNVSYPILDAMPTDLFSIKLHAAPKVGIDIPTLGTSSDNVAYNINAGLEGSVFYSGVLEVLTLYSNFRFAKVSGNSLFYSNLGREGDKRSFYFHQVSFGIAISSAFRLGYNFYFGSSFVNKNFPGNISFTFVPNS
ncbi:hypothetical protein [Parapedobacter sp. DT-150]|uniref:hypothetical protein n=1 Tax=Parapedobacter sp. DT-150 TaxID=3396162 RepID=UPI003F19E871